MKIFINYEEENTARHLNDAVNAVNKADKVSVSIPLGFRYSTTMQQNLRDISKSLTNLKNIRTWYAESQKNYQEKHDDFIEELRNFPKMDVQKYESIVK